MRYNLNEPIPYTFIELKLSWAPLIQSKNTGWTTNSNINGIYSKFKNVRKLISQSEVWKKLASLLAERSHATWLQFAIVTFLDFFTFLNLVNPINNLRIIRTNLKKSRT